MKRKFTYLLTALALLAFLSPTTAWGGVKLADTQRITQKTAHETESVAMVLGDEEPTRAVYSIAFQSTDGDDSSTELNSTTALNAIADGSTYISSISNISKVYKGKNGYGWKLGTGSAVGTFVMNLSNSGQVTATKITIKTAKYGSDSGKVKITLNNNSSLTYEITPQTNLTETEWTLSSATAITSIKIATTSKRAYVHSVKVTYGSSYNIAVSPSTISVDEQEHYAGNGDDEYLSMTTNISGYNPQDYTVHYCATENGTYTATEPSWMSAEVYYTNDWVVYWNIGQNTSSIPNECYFKVYNSTNNVYSNAVHVTQSAHVGIPTTVTIEPNSGFSNDLNNNPTGGLLVATVTANNQPIQANVTWASSNTNVATVNQYGVVTLVAVGQTDITATYAGDNTYAGSTGTYQLNVINSAPWVTATPASLNSFSYVVGHGPSAAQTISVEGGNLSGSVTVELDGAPSNFEISLDGTTWTSSVALQLTGSTLEATNVSVRMKAGLVVDGYSDVLRVKRNNSNMLSINLSGSVQDITIISVADAIEATPSSGTSDNVFIHGFVSSFYNNGASIISDNYHRYYITDNTTTDQLLVFNGKGLNNVAFSNADDLLVGDEVIICGGLTKFQNAPEVAANNYIVSLTRPESYTLTVSSLPHAEMFVFAGSSTQPLFEGVGSGSVIEGASVTLSVEPEYGYVLSSLMVDGTNHVNDIEGGAYVFTMPSYDVDVTVETTRLAYHTVTFKTNGVLETTMDIVQGDKISDAGTLPTATPDYIPAGYEFMGWYADDYEMSSTAPATYVTDAFEPDNDVIVNAVFAEVVTPGGQETWTKITNLSTVTEGIYALIDDDGYAFNGTMNSDHHGQHTTGTFSFTDGVATSAPEGTCELTFVASGTDGYKMYNSQYGYLYAKAKASKNLYWHDSEDSYWKFASDNWTYNGNGAYLRVYNHTFRTYSNNSNEPLYMAKKTPGSPAVYGNYRTSLTESSDPLAITGYGQSAGGYRLIASPVYVSPSSVTDMLANSYDLYYFDQDEEYEWRNYKQDAFNLEPGKGYLYANSATVSLTFTGTAYSGDGQVSLKNTDGAFWAGWNLIGNPYATGMVLKDANNGNKAFYTLNPAGNELMAGTAGTEIAAMEGVFVEAMTDGEVVSFVEETGGGGAGGGGFDFISLNVSRNRGASAGSATIDRAIIGIGDGPMLHKFQLNPSNTKIYITEANQDYAIVRSANEGEQPVSFRASENGTYTLSVNPEGVEMNYLHLIDNMTGADVDLLATPSYTFEAKTSDYASRFRLMFSANSISEDADGDNAFAYFNGSSWTVSNMGEATLQVVDVMGRVISSEQINGNAEVSINQPSGVYMLRLVSGDSVKVQKVVVR